MEDAYQRAQSASAVFELAYTNNATWSWIGIILFSLLISIFGAIRGADTLQLAALVFFAGLFLAFTAWSVRKVANRSWAQVRRSPLAEGFWLVYPRAIAANFITMALFFKTYFKGNGVTALAIPIYVAAFVWGIWLSLNRYRLRLKLGRESAAIYREHIPESSSGYSAPLDVKLNRVVGRWTFIFCGSLLVGFLLFNLGISDSVLALSSQEGSLSDVLTSGGLLLMAAGITCLVGEALIRLPIDIFSRNRRCSFIQVRQAEADAISLHFDSSPRLARDAEIAITVTLMQRMPGEYERESREFGSAVSTSEMQPSSEHSTAEVGVFLPKLPASVTDRQYLKYLLRINIRSGGSHWATKESVDLPEVAVLAP